MLKAIFSLPPPNTSQFQFMPVHEHLAAIQQIFSEGLQEVPDLHEQATRAIGFIHERWTIPPEEYFKTHSLETVAEALAFLDPPEPPAPDPEEDAACTEADGPPVPAAAPPAPLHPSGPPVPAVPARAYGVYGARTRVRCGDPLGAGGASLEPLIPMAPEATGASKTDTGDAV